MGKKSKQIGREKSNLIVDSSKSQLSQEKKEELRNRIMELSDEQLESLFEKGRISQTEYEAILQYRKKQKKKKTEKEKFEERIRCNNGIIQKIVNLGRKFRRQEYEYNKYGESIKNKDKILDRDERIRSNGGQRQMERGRGSSGRTHDR